VLRFLSLLLLLPAVVILDLPAQPSVARQWNEAALAAVRRDFARPNVHARNLFHLSAAMYDAWAVYHSPAQTFFLGRSVGGYTIPFTGIAAPSDAGSASNEAVSFAAYRILKHRFQFSPGAPSAMRRFDSLMVTLGYDTSFVSVAYGSGPPAALGNYIAQSVIAYGLQDGSNEANGYVNQFYAPVNLPINPMVPGNPLLFDPNRWQPITVGTFIDQAGNQIPVSTPPFLGAEWGRVTPFALTAAERTDFTRDGHIYPVYHDPGPPPRLSTSTVGGLSEEYKWGYALVSIWQGHHDPADGVVWDISPGAMGGASVLPSSAAEYRAFYRLIDGGDIGQGRPLNPKTGQPYAPNLVPRADFARVLAEFWADGPTSETPPGHWFAILNYACDHPQFERRFRGTGPVVDKLEWDVKGYLALGGAMHDVAVTVWGIKGWYDGVRPLSAIRYMADLGQSSDSTKPRFHPGGLPLVPGHIEIVVAGDSLAGASNEHVGKIKLRTWRGPLYIANPDTQIAGVGWILGEDWWPYQRPSFVTPPFGGFISGHSAYSRAAAEVLTTLTGDEYFPGGLGTFQARKNQYLVFEEGPSVDVTLQWATYRDAAAQSALSRIWGGIHPPMDDMPGRKIGQMIGNNSVEAAERYFTGTATSVRQTETTSARPYVLTHPNPLPSGASLAVELPAFAGEALVVLYNVLGQEVFRSAVVGSASGRRASLLPAMRLPAGFYVVRVTAPAWEFAQKLVIIR
jgi:hypothetical protein